MIWIWIVYMRDTKKLIDNTVEIDFKPFGLVYQIRMKLKRL